jgi:hypothetical protein
MIYIVYKVLDVVSDIMVDDVSDVVSDIMVDDLSDVVSDDISDKMIDDTSDFKTQTSLTHPTPAPKLICASLLDALPYLMASLRLFE